ncbi:hypothetical protein HYW99_02000 [Candidatus Woesearchaeota archaeon]|nr:hypothetical protein [Candidatus Woesearchaeota archaeon]
MPKYNDIDPFIGKTLTLDDGHALVSADALPKRHLDAFLYGYDSEKQRDSYGPRDANLEKLN